MFSFLKKTPLEAARWVVIDCETSGLDPARDRLLSVGAVAVEGGRVRLDQSYGAVLRQSVASSRENILVHGLAGDAQLGGRPAQEVIAELGAFLADGVPVAFHAAFDSAVLRRAGLRPRRAWLDLAPLAAALFPMEGRRRALDHWLERFGLEPAGRHDALFDAAVSAELLLVLLAEARRQGSRTVEDVLGAAASSRFLSPG